MGYRMTTNSAVEIIREAAARLPTSICDVDSVPDNDGLIADLCALADVMEAQKPVAEINNLTESQRHELIYKQGLHPQTPLFLHPANTEPTPTSDKDIQASGASQELASFVDAGLISRLQSFRDRLCNDQRSALMFEGDESDLLDTINLLKQIKRTKPFTHADAGEVDRLKSTLTSLKEVYDATVDTHKREVALLDDAIVRLKAERRNWLDTDLTAKTLVKQEEAIDKLESQLSAIKQAVDRSKKLKFTKQPHFLSAKEYREVVVIEKDDWQAILNGEKE